MPNVAVIGLGIMGHAMADHFRAGGHDVAVWNRSPAKADDLVAAGARRAATPADAATGADLVIEVTADDASSRSVWLDAGTGALAGASPGAVLATSATLSVGWVAELAGRCADAGLPFLDMPLTGGRVGAGTRFKLILNSLQALHLAGYGEAMRLARATGLDERAVGEALVERPGGVMTQMAFDAYPDVPERVSFSVEWAFKDLNYAADMAEEAGGVDTPFLDDLRTVFRRTVDAGRATADWTAINDPAL